MEEGREGGKEGRKERGEGRRGEESRNKLTGRNLLPAWLQSANVN